MGIVNRGRDDSAEPSTPPKGIVRRRGSAVEATTADVSQEPVVAKRGNGLVVLFLCLVIVGLAGGTWWLWGALGNTGIDEVALDVDIRRLVKIDGAIALLEQRIENNRVTLQRMEDSSNQVLVNTLSLALKQNLMEMEEHQEQLVATMLEIHETYQLDEDFVIGRITEEIALSEDEYKTGIQRALTDLLGLLQTMPADAEPRVFLEEKIKVVEFEEE